MGFNILNIFKKKKKKAVEVEHIPDILNQNELVKCNELLIGSTTTIAEQLLSVVRKSVHVSSEIQRLEKIQNRTKKKRTKNKLQKRIDRYGK